MQRRKFLSASLNGALASALIPGTLSDNRIKARYELLDEVAAGPVLDKSVYRDSLKISKLDLLRYGDSFLCRVISENGAEGISVGNSDQLDSVYPVFLKRLKPFFMGKDARDIESLLDEVYVYKSNYKLQNLALWVPLATIEFAILDMLGKISRKSIGELIGTIHNPKIAVYQANGDRGITAEKTIDRIKKQLEESDARAIKFKIGGRMSKNREEPPGRTEKLIPLVRKTFGDKMVLYADSNGSYDTNEAIRIGKILEEYKIDFYEEPVPFDWYEETKEVADSLKIPVAGGEQEPSHHMFRWLIANNALSIVQPDMFYFGGMIRSVRIARMAAAMGKECTPHISGNGIGYLYMMHFVSAIPNAGPYHEFKGFNNELPFICPTSTLDSNTGVVTVPTGPGLGIEIDPEYIRKHTVLT